ncbi:hypothetical protein ACFCXC_18360 [Streptomyces microflavus]|uniref:hypothetical protein n=1 Tax=Streptomyces microflavus TaxID=1919 RepID=UPI0035DD5D36
MSVQRCREAFTIWRGGAPITYTAGQLVPDKDPILGTHGHLFQDVAEAAQRPAQAVPAEAATNEPGQRRSLTPPASVPDPDQDPGGDADSEAAGGDDPEQTAFDPTSSVTREVLAYLDTVGEAEALRVLDAEAAGEDRAGIRKMREQVLEAARGRDQLATDTTE